MPGAFGPIKTARTAVHRYFCGWLRFPPSKFAVEPSPQSSLTASAASKLSVRLRERPDLFDSSANLEKRSLNMAHKVNSAASISHLPERTSCFETTSNS